MNKTVNEQNQMGLYEINIRKSLLLIWKGRIVVLFGVVLFTCYGGWKYSNRQPIDSYEAACTLLTIPSDSLSVKLLDGSRSIELINRDRVPLISPTVYPEIVYSTPFLHKLMTCGIELADGRRCTLADYCLFGGSDVFMNSDTSRLVALNTFEFVHLTQNEYRGISLLRKVIKIQADYGGAIKISATMQDPLVVAQLVQYIHLELQRYVSDLYINTNTKTCPSFVVIEPVMIPQISATSHVSLSRYLVPYLFVGLILGVGVTLILPSVILIIRGKDTIIDNQGDSGL